MPMHVIQASYNSGEWSPSLYARVDIAKYHTGAALLRNFFVDYRGGASTRVGTKYVLQAYKSNRPVRLIPFQASLSVQYILEFGDEYIRFHSNGAPVLETAINITGATQANPCVLTITQSWSVGDWIYVSGVVGMTQLNGKYYIITARTGTTVTISDLFGTAVNSSAFTAYSSGGTAARVYTLVSPYDADDLALLKFTQNVNTMIFCHPSYAPQALAYTAPTNWAIGAITFGTTVGTPTGVTATPSAAAVSVYNYGYVVTAIDSDGQESVASALGLLNNWGDIRSGLGTITVTWTPVAGAASYNVYRADIRLVNPVPAGVPMGFIGNVSGALIYDTNVAPDFSESPPVAKNPFAASNHPSVPAFFQQRLVLGGPTASPQTLYMSQTGNYYNYDVHNPLTASDAITASIVSGALNNIKALIPQPSGLIVLTDGASFLINGGSLGSVVTPLALASNPQSFLGCNDMPPIVVNFDILYVQSRGSSVRDASYNFYANVFTGSDISVISSHLFFGYELLEWAWAEEPYKIVWAVRNDGTLLSLTFLKEQEFTGWAHSDTTGGAFKSVACIVEPATVGYQNYPYFVVERTVAAATRKYIEYMPERIYANGVEDAICVDCAYTYSGSPATSFTGATALAGLTVTGLADGEVITPFTMPTNGSFTLASAASKVSIGIGFTAQLKTLYLDTGNPTIQGKMKKISPTTVRVTETLGLKIGTDFDNLVTMKDLIVGNVGSQTNEVVTDLVTGDAQTYIDPKWQEQGVFCIQQDLPLPATILGTVPELTVENGEDRR